jgi:hypothetical protein
VVGGLHGPHQQLYCAHCRNWIFTHAHGLDFFVNIRATMLDEHRWYVPFVEVFTSEKLPWATTAAEHSFATQPDLAGYAPLLRPSPAKGRVQADEAPANQDTSRTIAEGETAVSALAS